MEGKTALVLSGGGARGAYEIGVCQALEELDIRIDSVYGASVGSINAAIIAQNDLDFAASLWKELETDKVFDMAPNSKASDYVKEIVINQGAGTSNLKKLLEKYIDEERVRKTHLDFGLTCVSLPKYEAHYMRLKDIPEGMLIDYIIASSSAFPALHSYKIGDKEYIDGGYCDVFPVGMALEDGAKNVIAVDLSGFGIVHYDDFKKVDNLIMIKSKLDLGFPFIFDKDNTKKIMKLGYYDCLKAFNVLDGDRRTFAKGTFSKVDLSGADYLGYIFNLDSTKIYTKDMFLEKIRTGINDVEEDYKELEKALNKKSIKSIFDFYKENEDDIKSLNVKKLISIALADILKKNNEIDERILKLLPGSIKELLSASDFLVKYDLL